MRGDRRLKDANREKRIYAFRTLVAVLVVLLLTGILVFRLYQLQWVQHQHFKTLSDKNRMQLQSIAPTRGLILDRNGVLLADNQPVFSLAIVTERVSDLDATLADVRAIIDISEQQIERFKTRLERSRRPFQPVILKSKLSEEEIARIEVRRHELKGVEIEAELARHYPLGGATAHSVGYVGRINQKELTKVDERNYSATNYIGKLGVERFYEDVLHGRVGFQTVETNAGNRVLRVLERVDPLPGADLTLHMDARLQRRAMQELEGKRGAVVAIEPDTGGILALVSTPSFDPNPFVTGIDHKSYAELRDSLDLPLFNRALKGQYPPGSTIKQVIGWGGLDSNVTTQHYTMWDPGWYQLQNDERIYRDWKREGHGRMDLKHAIAESCDTYFYDLAFKMGVDRMSHYLGLFGFGQNTALDISEARSGILPTRDWKRAIKGRPWYPGDSLNLGIGQGFMLATPLQLATMTAMIANNGKWVAPRMLKHSSVSGTIELPERLVEMDDLPIRREADWQYILDSMEEVMHGRKGTARSSGARSSYRMAGKTGTAQVVGIKQGEEYDAEALKERHRDHALFVGFAPIDDPQIAIAVIVENGGGGSTSAAPVARKLFDAWLLEFDHEQTTASVAEPLSEVP
ncbi:MAG: penicillin-binding protein 2 [Oleiphilaceae bacterium]|nr:penicillin-binding protein 2 [Oleiphilaceae bacterium]